MRRWMIFGGVAALAVVAAFGFGPATIERVLNRVDPIDAPALSDRATALHESLFVVDLHDDALLWGRDLLVRGDRGHSDLVRWREGRVSLQVLPAVTKTPAEQNFERNAADSFDPVTALSLLQRWPPSTRRSLYARATFLATRFDKTVERSQGALQAVRTKTDLDELVKAHEAGDPVVGVLLAAEGLHPLEGDLSHLESMVSAGYRMLAPTHFFDNEISGSAHGEEKGGLTPLGERVIDRMQELGIVIDVAHASPRAVDDILDRAEQPIVVSHTGVQATCPGPRNLSDDQILRIAKSGGVVGVGFFAGAVCDISPDGVVRAMRHVADLVGVEHVAVGSDWNGATRVQIDASRLVYLTDALIRSGFDDSAVRQIMGGNALRVLRRVLPEGV